jgi:colanic acid/amylovoran biosynthesis glycosyltransferase
MKIGIILSRPPAFSETFFRNKIRDLRDQGHEVILYVDHRDTGFTDCPQKSLPARKSADSMLQLFRTLLLHPVRTVRFIRLERRLRNSWTVIMKNFMNCLHLLQAGKHDWIHFGFATMAVGRESVARTLGARMGISLRGFDISRFPLRNPGAYRNVWQRVDRVHAISRALLGKAIALGMPPSADTRIIHPAIDNGYFKDEPSAEAFPERIQLLTVARLHWTKGIEYTLAALALLARSERDFHYTVVGDGRELERYVFAAHQFGISDRVTFAGKARHEDLPQYYRKAHIYIQYSVQEGFCNAVLEAQSMGLPCIVSNAEGLPENVLDGKTGWVVPRRQPELLAAKLLEVIAMNPSARAGMCTNAVKRVKEQFDLEKQKSEFVKFFS